MAIRCPKTNLHSEFMNEISFLGARLDAFNVLALDDPELCKYPVAYITESRLVDRLTDSRSRGRFARTSSRADS